MMKNNLEPEEEMTRKWVKEAGTEYPGDSFQFTILKRIKELEESGVVYKPVISSKGWQLILFYVASIIGLSTFSNTSIPEGTSFLDKLPALKIPTIQLNQWQFANKWFDFSPQFTLSIIIFLILGFVMIMINLRNRLASL